MKETMGQVIRRLRREKNLSQEQLAEQLGVTFQAVSKWENDAGMPDISQVVPIAHVFGVSTDVLFGMRDTNDREEVMKIFDYAQSFIDSPLTSDGLYKKYCALKDGLKLYPNNMILLTGILEAGVSLAYPENDVYDEEHAGAIRKPHNLIFAERQRHSARAYDNGHTTFRKRQFPRRIFARGAVPRPRRLQRPRHVRVLRALEARL